MTFTSRDSSDLLRVAEAIADGAEIDWQDASLARASLRSRLDRLRVVEKIRSVHQTPFQSVELAQTVSKPQTAAPTDALPEIPEKWGPLQIKSRIGAGAYGEVFRAHDPALQQDCALKLLYPWSETGGTGDIDEGTLAEGRGLASVRHENVLTVHGAARHDGRVGLWTDLVDGQTLDQVLASQGPLGFKEAAVIGMDLCRALAAVHAKGLVHGDLKASNVMREAGSGKIILMDFSSVRERRGTSTEAGPLCGTPIYMAPELLRGRDAGAASDIYSMGVLLYRLVTRRFPVEAASIRELLDKMGRGETEPLREIRPDLPRRFIQVVERALELDPEDRYRSVADMERDLDRVLRRPIAGPAAINPLRVAAAVGVIGLFLLVRFAVAPFDIQASVHRSTGIGSVMLAEGARVSPGDRLYVEIESNRRMHVYVLNSSRKEDYVALFPMPEFDLQNPLAAGTYQLPGTIDGTPKDWRVGNPEGQETILVIASRTPLPDLEQSMKKMRQTPPEEVRLLAEGRRSIDSYVTRPDPKELAVILDLLATGERQDNADLKIMEFRLSNPKPN